MGYNIRPNLTSHAPTHYKGGSNQLTGTLDFKYGIIGTLEARNLATHMDGQGYNLNNFGSFSGKVSAGSVNRGTLGMDRIPTLTLAKIPTGIGAQKLLGINGLVGSFASPDTFPKGLAFDDRGFLWNVDTKGGIVYGYIFQIGTADGRLIGSFASPEPFPVGLAFDDSGFLWNVTNQSDYIFQIGTADGRLIGSFASPDTLPKGLAFDDSGFLWNSDSSTDYIYQIGTADGRLIGSFSSPSTSPSGLSFDISGFLWNGDDDTNYTYQIGTADGRLIGSFSSPSTSAAYLALDASNFIWFADNLNNYITRVNTKPLIDDQEFATSVRVNRGTFGVAVIPNLSGAKITSGTVTVPTNKIDSARPTPGSGQVFFRDGTVWAYNTSAGSYKPLTWG